MITSHCLSFGHVMVSRTDSTYSPLLKTVTNQILVLRSIYPEKTMTHKDTCTLMFIAALFSIVKTWKQPKCPSIEEWIKKM